MLAIDLTVCQMRSLRCHDPAVLLNRLHAHLASAAFVHRPLQTQLGHRHAGRTLPSLFTTKSDIRQYFLRSTTTSSSGQKQLKGFLTSNLAKFARLSLASAAYVDKLATRP